MKLILVSRSSARQRMLHAAGVAFETADAGLDEDALKRELAGASAQAIAMALAEAKALAVAVDGLLLGSDQTLELDDATMLSKPASPVEVRAQLRRMSGRTHRLHAAAAIAEDGAIVWRAVERVEMTMRPLSDSFIDDYVEKYFETVRWSVGGYHIEGVGAQLFEQVDGNHFAIQGLPLLPLLAYLRKRGLLAS